ncbi:MAG TPA: ABC transporter permease [Flavitalea sp.]|nr:ABC transporter permease [Flavitalea sp.]
MFRNYLKTAFRNLTRNKVSSIINIVGLSVGMAVTMLIALWIYDELMFEKYHDNYDNIVQVLQSKNLGEGKMTQESLPMPLVKELENNYGSDLKKIAATSFDEPSITYGDKNISSTGLYTNYSFTEIITLKILRGSKSAAKDRGTILINESLAKAIFGDTDPVNKIIKVRNFFDLKVAGVYQDLPHNTQFHNANFIAPIDLLFVNGGDDNWFSSSFRIFAVLNPGSQPEAVSAKIKTVLYEHNKSTTSPALFLHPMKKWHLYNFKNGVLIPGRLEFVWLFGIIGIFVLILACINFMNLSTARSERRAKEVGIRKAVGSLRSQLIGQFFSESLLVVLSAFIVALLLVQLSLPWFNDLAAKQMKIIWNNGAVWIFSLAFCIITGLIAGSYPAIYLSSFKPVKVLKGTFRVGRFAAVPRRVLVVIQFTVSVTLIIGTIIVFRQIQYAKNRPIGYSRNNLITIPYNSQEMKLYSAFRNELLKTGVVTDIAKSSSPTTGIWSSADNLEWQGKDPNRQEMFGTILVDPDYGNVVEWQIKDGRGFSPEFPADSSCFLFNETAIKQMGLKDPLGQLIKWHGKDWRIIGVVKDMVMTSPFNPITPTVFLMDSKERSFNVINLKINGSSPVQNALGKIESVFKKFNPGFPFTYKFADEEYALKFAEEERVGKLATFFATLAVLISCLGLFGMASFVAEQRNKEIGVRKVLGASVFSIWKLLSRDFVLLVAISCAIASPIAYHFLNGWLQNYDYRTTIEWPIFAVAGGIAMIITLLTISFQSIKAALVNPVKTLRSE